MTTHIKNYFREVALPAYIMKHLHRDYGFSEQDAIKQTLKHMPYIRKAFNAHPIRDESSATIIAATVAELRKAR